MTIFILILLPPDLDFVVVVPLIKGDKKIKKCIVLPFRELFYKLLSRGVIMKIRILFSVLGFTVCSFIPGRSSAHAFLPQDTTKATTPVYKNVNVVVEYSWDGIERSERVDVQVNLNDKKPNVVISKENVKQCEVLLFKGVAVKIYSRETGKLLKTIQVEK